MHKLLEKLNSRQREAVETTEGAVLIIAGAGSGKTLALTHRVAYLIQEKKVNPRNILAVTFTNKAANEMKERIIKLLSEEKFSRDNFPIVGTFHSICVKILRHEIEKIGYKKSFNIFDTQDQQGLIKKTMKELSIDLKQFKPKSILGAISKAKNNLIGADDFAKQAGGYYEEIVAKVYVVYQKKLKEQNALDFDDILMFTVKVFHDFPEVLEKYQRFFKYIMVDEYQDTNHAQYDLISMIAKRNKNICVVGDDWQGVYSFRGANIQNILDFEKDYPEAKVIKLEQNYRSSQNILDAAYGIISKNINRKDKKIWTEQKGGHLISSYEALSEKDEAEFMVAEVLTGTREKKYKFRDFVVLYRTNAQSRIIEESMLKNSIPYRIVGGLKFYQRKEIKDMVAYLRLIQNHDDLVSLERIINEPRRSIGPVSLKKWTEFAQSLGLNLVEAGLKIGPESKLNESKIDAIKKFCDFIRRSEEKISKESMVGLIGFVFSHSGYEKMLMDGTEEGEIRKENIYELLTVAKKYDEYIGAEGLRLFLEEVALVSDTDDISQEIDAVHLMTLHSAKGLEFKIVFIAGLEEGILPHSRSMLNQSEMEEERRLMYVGVTRAKEKVYLLFTSERNIFGSTQSNAPSRFLDDIPSHLIQAAETPSLNFQFPNKFQNSKYKLKTKHEIQFIKNSKSKSNGVTSYELQVTSFKDGNRVIHEVFGEGIIVASQGDTLTVAFSKSGLKKLSASIAPLKKV